MDAASAGPQSLPATAGNNRRFGRPRRPDNSSLNSSLAGRKSPWKECSRAVNFIYNDMVPLENTVDELLALLVYYQRERKPDESLGDFCDPLGRIRWRRPGFANLFQVIYGFPT